MTPGKIKKSLIATWEDLDSESDSDKEEADDGANVVVGLVATVTPEAERESNSEDEKWDMPKSKGSLYSSPLQWKKDEMWNLEATKLAKSLVHELFVILLSLLIMSGC